MDVALQQWPSRYNYYTISMVITDSLVVLPVRLERGQRDAVRRQEAYWLLRASWPPAGYYDKLPS